MISFAGIRAESIMLCLYISDGRQMHRKLRSHHHNHSSMERRQMGENLVANKDIENHQMIPRTQTTTPPKPLTPKELYDLLVPKLKAIKIDQEMKDLLSRKLTEVK